MQAGIDMVGSAWVLGPQTLALQQRCMGLRLIYAGGHGSGHSSMAAEAPTPRKQVS